mmetsp:Transcript_526/g.754  ORF Transcript_526/g.754 Transcript_526/m.754 type:complete len:133 (+) Transcript_526:68-466(+)
MISTITVLDNPLPKFNVKAFGDAKGLPHFGHLIQHRNNIILDWLQWRCSSWMSCYQQPLPVHSLLDGFLFDCYTDAAISFNNASFLASFSRNAFNVVPRGRPPFGLEVSGGSSSSWLIEIFIGGGTASSLLS